MRYGILFLLLLLLQAQKASAQGYHLNGAGTFSCGRWTADRKAGGAIAALEESWVLGFLSGVGFVGVNGADPLQNIDSEGVAAWIDNYCLAYPVDNLANAAQAFTLVHPH